MVFIRVQSSPVFIMLIRSIIISFVLQILLSPSAFGIHPQFVQTKRTSRKLEDVPSLENLARRDKDAYTIWNITQKYNLIKETNITENCTYELQNNNRLIPYYLINRTMYEGGIFMYMYSRQAVKYSLENELWYAKALYDNHSSVIVDMELYFNIMHKLINGLETDSNNTICPSNSVCGCISEPDVIFYEEQLFSFKNYRSYLSEFIIFGNYIDPTIRLILIFLGLVVNGSLLLLFIKETCIRSESHILIFNLCLNNFLMLLVYLPVQYAATYHLYHLNDRSHLIPVQVFVVSVNTMSVLLLNIQRNCDVLRIFNQNSNSQRCQLRPVYRCVIYLVAIWATSIGIGIQFAFLSPLIAYALETLLYFLIFVLIFSIVLSVFNAITARKLQKAAEEGCNSIEFQHLLSSGVILSLTILYYATHIPFFIYRVFESGAVEIELGFYIPSVGRIIIFFMHVIFMIYPTLNVVFLYLYSGVYRKLFRNYIFHRKNDVEERQYMTMGSVANAE